MEKTVVEFIKQRVEEDSDTSFFNIDWDKFDEIIEQAKEMEVKQKGYTKNDVESMLHKCCEDLENNPRAFWNIDGLVNEIVSNFKSE